MALANQAGARGIIYHAKLAGAKGDTDTMWAPTLNTCCAGQGTRLLGALPEFIYSTAPDGIYVNLFENSAIQWEHAGATVRLEMSTRFPFDPAVALRVSVPQPLRLRIRVRVPGWASEPMAIQVNGAPAATGRPGAYVALDRTWTAGDTIAFTLPLRFRMTRYSGQEKIGNAYALEYGPILMAVVGDVDAQGAAAISLRAEDLPARLRPTGEAPLHFAIEGDARHSFRPYWQVAVGQSFTCYPAFA